METNKYKKDNLVICVSRFLLFSVTFPLLNVVAKIITVMNQAGE